MDPFPMRPLPGSTLDPEHVVGRDATVLGALRQLGDGTNLLLSDPRRMGKTAFLDRLCHRPSDGVDAVKIDYEGVTSVTEFVGRTMRGLRAHRGLWKRIAGAVKVYVKEVDVERGGFRVKGAFAHKDPATLLVELIEGIDRRIQEDRLLVIAMDELPLAVDNIVNKQGPSEAQLLLQALRSSRGRQATSIRWIVTGSVGFHHVLRRSGATEGVLNDLVNLPLGPLTDDGAEFLARCLLMGIRQDPADQQVTNAMVRHSGGIPYLLHMLAHQVANHAGPLTASHVGSAFDAFIEDRDQSRAVTHFLTRLDTNYGALAATAYQVLDMLADAEPLGIDELRAASADSNQLLMLMDDLQDDHYVVRHDATWRWRYPILRRIWRNRRNLHT